MRQKRVFQVFIVLPIILITVLYLGFDLVNLTRFSYPYELREGANIALTKCFLTGVNPYKVATSINGEMPSLFYMYPFMYSILVAGISVVLPFIKLPLLHYIVSFSCGVGAAAIGAIIVRRKSVSLFAPWMTFFLMLSCSWRGAYISAFPDTLALLISVLILYLVMFGAKKWHMGAIALLTIGLFFSKQYFVIIAISVWIYYLVVDRKKLLRYTLYCMIIGVLSVVVVSFAFPLYWTYGLFFVNGSTTRISVENIKFCVKQFCYIGFTFFPILIMCLFGILQLVVKRKEKLWRENEMVLYIHFIVAGLCLLKFGTNDGAYLTYFLQLLVPVMIILGVLCFERYVYPAFGSLDFNVCVLICFLFAGISVLNVTQKFANYVYLTKNDEQEWLDIYAYLDEYAGMPVYYSPNLAFYALEHNQYIYDLGQNEFVNYESEGITTLDTWKQSQIFQTLFPYVDDIIEHHMIYRARLREDIQEGKYDVVVETQYLYFEREDLEDQYELIDKYKLKSGTVTYETEVWKKR